MTEAPYAIELVGVTKSYGEVPALQDVNLEIEQGEFFVLLGPSGCGKSTILKIIAGLEDATAGDVYIQDKLANYLRPKQRDVAMVFQNYALYPHMTVETNLAFPLRMRGSSKEDIRRRVAEVAALLELGEQLARYPDQLSGGQRQRVALGRAIIRDPVAFLMDEPLSNLDALLRVQMRSELLKFHRRVGRTTVYVTHDQVEAMTMASRIVVMRSGVVQQVGTTSEIYAHPANTFVATFVGTPQMNLYAGRIERTADGTLFAGPVSAHLPASSIGSRLSNGDPVTLGIRPEHVSLCSPSHPAAIPGTVDLVEAVGAENYVSVTLGVETICTVRTSAKVVVSEGERVHLAFSGEELHLFDAGGSRLQLPMD